MGKQHRKIRKKKKLGSYPSISVIFSITLALFMLGLFGLLLIHTQKLKLLIQENVEVQVYLKKDLTENEIIQFNKILGSKAFVLNDPDQGPKISFVSKEQAATQFREDTGEDIVDFLGENPLRDAYTLKIKPEFQDLAQLNSIKSDLEKYSAVYEVTFVESLISSINRNLAKISIILIIIAMVLFLVVTILINNTIKLALFSQRFLIRSMQLVGATAGFIKKPFLLRATLHGTFSGFIASLLLILLLNYGNQQIEDLNRLQDPFQILVIFALLIFCGAFIGFISTYRSINKYLKLSLDELY
jgi:cell division transport system permease protein